MSEKIVVIGGRGFIGRRLVRLLAGTGREVVVVSRSCGGAAPERSVSFVRGDVADPQAISAAIKGASVVYDLAMGGGDTWADFERDFVEGTRNVANACLEHGVRRLIYVSSTSALYLGAARRQDERPGPDPEPLKRSLYSRGKIEAERVLKEMRESRGLPVVVARPAIVLGRGGMLNHGGLGTWNSNTCCIGWGRGRNPLPFVLVQDVAEALFAALDAPGIEGQSFNLAGDVRLSASEFVGRISERSLRRFRFYPRSLWGLQAVEIWKWLLKVVARKPDNPFPSYRDIKSRSMRTDLDCNAAKTKLGWKPVGDVESFLREAVDCHLDPIPAGDLRLAAAEGAR